VGSEMCIRDSFIYAPFLRRKTKKGIVTPVLSPDCA